MENGRCPEPLAIGGRHLDRQGALIGTVRRRRTAQPATVGVKGQPRRQGQIAQQMGHEGHGIASVRIGKEGGWQANLKGSTAGHHLIRHLGTEHGWIVDVVHRDGQWGRYAGTRLVGCRQDQGECAHIAMPGRTDQQPALRMKREPCRQRFAPLPVSGEGQGISGIGVVERVGWHPEQIGLILQGVVWIADALGRGHGVGWDNVQCEPIGCRQWRHGIRVGDGHLDGDRFRTGWQRLRGKGVREMIKYQPGRQGGVVDLRRRPRQHITPVLFGKCLFRHLIDPSTAMAHRLIRDGRGQVGGIVGVGDGYLQSIRHGRTVAIRCRHRDAECAYVGIAWGAAKRLGWAIKAQPHRQRLRVISLCRPGQRVPCIAVLEQVRVQLSCEIPVFFNHQIGDVLAGCPDGWGVGVTDRDAKHVGHRCGTAIHGGYLDVQGFQRRCPVLYGTIQRRYRVLETPRSHAVIRRGWCPA